MMLPDQETWDAWNEVLYREHRCAENEVCFHDIWCHQYRPLYTWTQTWEVD